MNAAHLSNAVSAMKEARALIDAHVPSGTAGKGDISHNLFSAATWLNAELSLIQVNVKPDDQTKNN